MFARVVAPSDGERIQHIGGVIAADAVQHKVQRIKPRYGRRKSRPKCDRRCQVICRYSAVPDRMDSRSDWLNRVSDTAGSFP